MSLSKEIAKVRLLHLKSIEDAEIAIALIRNRGFNIKSAKNTVSIEIECYEQDQARISSLLRQNQIDSSWVPEKR